MKIDLFRSLRRREAASSCFPTRGHEVKDPAAGLPESSLRVFNALGQRTVWSRLALHHTESSKTALNFPPNVDALHDTFRRSVGFFFTPELIELLLVL